MSASNCGCDLEAHHVCEWHTSIGRMVIDDTSEYGTYLAFVDCQEDGVRTVVSEVFLPLTVSSGGSMTGTTIAEVKAFRQALFDKSMALIDRKGADYNRDQQEAGDTLFNLRVCEVLGVVPSTEEGILVRLSDKFMRLISLTKPGREAAVKDESVLDTIADIHNYVDYLGLIWQQRRAEKP